MILYENNIRVKKIKEYNEMTLTQSSNFDQYFLYSEGGNTWQWHYTDLGYLHRNNIDSYMLSRITKSKILIGTPFSITAKLLLSVF